MARRSQSRTKLPIVVVLLVGALAVLLAAWVVFGREPQTVTQEPTVAVPAAADEPAPMPTPRPATAAAP